MDGHMNNNNHQQHRGGSGTDPTSTASPMDLRLDLSDLYGGTAGTAAAGGGTMGGGGPGPAGLALGLRRSSHNSSPAILSGTSSMRRTMSGSKRPAPNDGFGFGGGGGGGRELGGIPPRSRLSTMSRSSTFAASTSSNAVWDFNNNSNTHQGGYGGGGANWAGGGGGSFGPGGGGGGGGWNNSSASMGNDGGGEEASYQRSVGRSLNHLRGGRNPGSNPFLSQMQGGGGSSADMAQMLNRQNLLQQTAPSAGAGSAGGGGMGGGMGGAGLVFDPRLGTVGLAGAGTGGSGSGNSSSSGRRIPNPSGADFMAMMGLKRPEDGGGAGGGGGSSNSSMAGGTSSSHHDHHSHQRHRLGGMEVPLNDTARAGGHDDHHQQQVAVGPPGSIQGLKMTKRGSAMLRRSSQNLTELQRFKLPEEEGPYGLSDDDSMGKANLGGSGGGGGEDETVLQQLQRAQQQQQQQQQHQPSATSTATEIAQRMQQLRREQEKAQQTASAKMTGSGADDSASNEQSRGQGVDSGSPTSLSNLSGFSDISASEMQLLFNEELGGTGPGGGSSANGSAASLGSELAGFDFDQHAREVAAEVTDQVAAELMAGGGGGERGSENASATGAVDSKSTTATAAVAASTATGGSELEVDYASLLADFEPTPLSAQSEQILYARRQSTMSMGSEHSGTSALAGGISSMGGLGGVATIPLAAVESSTPGLHQGQAQEQFQEQQFSSMGTSMGSTTSTGMPASPAIPQMQQQAQFPQQAMQSPPTSAAVAAATASMAGAPDQANSSNPSAAAISVQSQLQHVAHGGAGTQQGVMASGLGVKSLDGPRDASWMVSAILQLSKVGPRVPDRDGLLPVHLACLYCPNEKKLVGNILIDNPDSATFIVSPPPENVDVEGANANPQDVIMSLTSNALAAARKKANPSVMMSQLQGSYPLHIVLRSFGGEKVTYEVVKLLALSGPGVLTTPDPLGCVPLSIALQNKVGSQIIRYLLEQNKDSARVPDRDSNYPLHHACMSARGKKKYSLAIIKLLTLSYPKALAKKNKEGKKPLDLAYGPKGRDDYLNEGKTDSAIEFLEKTYEKMMRKQQEKISSKG